MEILSNLAELTDERLAEYATEVRTAFDALIATEAPTPEQVSQAEAYADAVEAAGVERASRETAALELADRTTALRSRFTEETVEEAAATPCPKCGTVHAADESACKPKKMSVEEEAACKPKKAGMAGEVETAAAKPNGVRELAARTTRPPVTRQERAPIVITAAADVPEFSTGSTMDDMATVSTALVNRMRGFGTPSGDGKTENLQHYGVASFRMDFPPELTIDRHSDDMEVLAYAGNERRLEGDSLVASGGWCAPSEQLYDLCVTETTEGILSVPEVNIARGGIKYTSGPDFSTIYSSVGFTQTETQAIAGTVKACFEVPCPAFTETRLDAIGICIKAPILTNAAYPELVQRWLSGSMIAHQHRVNASVIARMVTAAGAAKVITGIGSTVDDTMGGLELIADGLRQKYRMSLNATLEVVVPFYMRGAFRSDLANRNGQTDAQAVSDSDIAAHWSERHLTVSYVYDWQDLVAPPVVAYPATYQALIYPAGTFIKGTSDVISLNAVYDAASLATNLYTALFFEQGLLVAKMCNEATLVTLPVCNAGRAGMLNFTCP